MNIHSALLDLVRRHCGFSPSFCLFLTLLQSFALVDIGLIQTTVETDVTMTLKNGAIDPILLRIERDVTSCLYRFMAATP